MFSLDIRDNFTIIHIQIDGVISPDILADLQPPDVNPRMGVVLSGRAPIWLYSYLVHHYHPTAWIAVYDPRLGAVVVSTHWPGISVGQVIDI